MKGIRVHTFGPPEVMTLERMEDLSPGPGEVVVAVKAAGVNPVDTYIRSGAFQPDLNLPYTPGFDAAVVFYGRFKTQRFFSKVSCTNRLAINAASALKNNTKNASR